MKKIRKLFPVLALTLAMGFCVPAAASQESSDPAADTSTETGTGTSTETGTGTSTETGTDTSGNKTTVTKKRGLVKVGTRYCYYNRKGQRVKNRWVNVGKNRYFFNAKGYSVIYSMKRNNYIYVFGLDGKLKRPKKPSIVTVGKNSYYVDTKGHATTGWFIYNNRLYRADPKGRLYKNRVYQGITFTKDGYAQTDTNSQLKIRSMQIVSQITNSSMTQAQKLRACWNYVMTHMSYYGYYPSGRTGWQKELALTALAYGRGNCYGFACAFAALAWEIGYDPYVIMGRVSGSRDGAADGMTRHCWVQINGAYYDPEATWAGWYAGVYGSGGYGIRHSIQAVVRFAG